MHGVLVFVTAFFVGLMAIPNVIRLLTKHGIFDSPSARKSHTNDKPTMGGIGIFLGVIFAIIVWKALGHKEPFLAGVASIILIFLTGLIDDVFALRARYKLLGQMMATVFLILFADVRLVGLYGMFGVGNLPYWASFMLTFFTIIVVTNSINLIDGIDGLAGVIVLTFLVFASAWFYSVQSLVEATISVAMAGGVCAFLIFNWYPSKIFMGDTGALLLGLTVAWLAIRFIDVNAHLLTNELFKVNAPVSIAIASIMIPLFDTLRVFSIRLIKKRSPFSPDKNHLHHCLLRYYGFTHAQTALTLFGVNLTFLAIAWHLRNLNDTLVLTILVAVLLIGYYSFIKATKYKISITTSSDNSNAFRNRRNRKIRR